MTDKPTPTHFMGIPLEDFANTDCYVAKRLINGDRRHCTYPESTIPKLKVSSGFAPTAAHIFGFNPDNNRS